MNADITMDNFIQLEDDCIINVKNVTLVTRINGTVFVKFVGEDGPLRMDGRRGTAIWAYFSSGTSNICPLNKTEEE